MNFAEKNALIERADKRRTGISDEKGPEYTGEADSYKANDANILTNFYVRAERGKVSVFTVAQTYAGKHIDSIETTLAELAQAVSISSRLAIVRKGEGLISRLDDLRNYCDLLECILMEEGVHPENIDKQAVANHELLAEAERLDWSAPGYSLKKDTTEATLALREGGDSIPPLSTFACPEVRFCTGPGPIGGRCCHRMMLDAMADSAVGEVSEPGMREGLLFRWRRARRDT